MKWCSGGIDPLLFCRIGRVSQSVCYWWIRKKSRASDEILYRFTSFRLLQFGMKNINNYICLYPSLDVVCFFDFGGCELWCATLPFCSNVLHKDTRGNDDSESPLSLHLIKRPNPYHPTHQLRVWLLRFYVASVRLDPSAKIPQHARQSLRRLRHSVSAILATSNFKAICWQRCHPRS